MTKDDMLEIIGRHCACGKGAAEYALSELFDTMAAELAGGGEVKLPGVGKMKYAATPGRPGTNPRTGEKIAIPPGYRVKLTPAKAMRDRLAALPAPMQQAAE